MAKDLTELLDDLHKGLAEKLRERLNSDEITAAELNVVRQFLKDNGIDSVPTDDNPLGRLVADLPFTTSSEISN